MTDMKLVNGCKSFGPVQVLKDVNLEIASGELVVFLGPSGCGKSTLLRVISGLEEISSGEIWLDGQLVNDVDPASRGIAMVFQSYALYPHMTVFQNMAFSLKMAKEPKTEIAEKVLHAAKILQLEELLDRRPGQLSGGQRQRVAIGRAIVRAPRVFLFDEPLSNLDAELRVQMRAELIQLHARLGTTMIYVTHDQVEAMTLADKMVVMNDGRIQQIGPPLDLYDNPANKFVAGFIGSPRMNFMKASVESVRHDSMTLGQVGGGGRLDLKFPRFDPSIGEVELGIRTENVGIGTDSAEPDVLSTRVAFVEELGDATLIHADLPNGERLVIRGGRDRWSGEAHCLARLDLDEVLLFNTAGERIRSPD